MVSLSRSLLTLTLAVLALGSASSTEAPVRASIGRDLPMNYAVNATTRTPWEQTISVAGAKFLTVHFSRFHLADGDVVTIRDATTGAVVAEYTGLGRGDLGDKGGFFSPQVFSSAVSVEYTPSMTIPASGDFGFAIDRVVRSAASATVSAICGVNQQVSAKCYDGSIDLPLAYTKAQAVARLTRGSTPCTGWLVGSEGHLLTNFHCIASQAEASSTDYEFAAESPTCEDQCLTTGSCRGNVVATTATFVGGDADLDYALVKLNTTVNVVATYGFLTLRVAGGTNQEQIYVPQHPRGRAKQLATTVDGGSVARATMGVSDGCGAYRVAYAADTEGGSSGSPVLAARDNTVIALHSCGTSGSSCVNTGVDIRPVVYDMMKKNILPANALDDPSAGRPTGPWGQ